MHFSASVVEVLRLFSTKISVKPKKIFCEVFFANFFPFLFATPTFQSEPSQTTSFLSKKTTSPSFGFFFSTFFFAKNHIFLWIFSPLRNFSTAGVLNLDLQLFWFVSLKFWVSTVDSNTPTSETFGFQSMLTFKYVWRFFSNGVRVL